MKYKSVIVTRNGGPEVLQVIENDLRAPAAGEVRIQTLAAAVCRPDITARSGEALYSGTPLGAEATLRSGICHHRRGGCDRRRRQPGCGGRPGRRIDGCRRL